MEYLAALMATRLDAILAHAGLGTRKEVRSLLRAGRVLVDGQPIRDQGQHIAPEAAITVDGEALARAPTDDCTLLLHKPIGYACSRTAEEAPLAFELLPRHLAGRVEAAGRLDRATSGLLVLSTDGQLLHRLVNPKRKIGKRYRIAYHGELVRDAVARCAAGLLLEDRPEPTRPASLYLEGRDAQGLGRASMILHEGRYHQVRRMIAALGGEVVHLHRDCIGALELPADLEPGAWREATAAEGARLQMAATAEMMGHVPAAAQEFPQTPTDSS